MEHIATILHLTLPSDLSTYVTPKTPEGSSAQQPVRNRCLVVKELSNTVRLTLTEAALHHQSSITHSPPPTSEFRFDAIAVSPNDAPISEAYITPILQRLYHYVQAGNSRSDSGEQEDDQGGECSSATVLVHGNSSTNREDLFHSLLLNATFVLKHGEEMGTFTKPSSSSSTVAAASPLPSSLPLPAVEVGFSVADLYDAWQVGDVLDPHSAVHVKRHPASTSPQRFQPLHRSQPHCRFAEGRRSRAASVDVAEHSLQSLSDALAPSSRRKQNKWPEPIDASLARILAAVRSPGSLTADKEREKHRANSCLVWTFILRSLQDSGDGAATGTPARWDENNTRSPGARSLLLLNDDSQDTTQCASGGGRSVPRQREARLHLVLLPDSDAQRQSRKTKRELDAIASALHALRTSGSEKEKLNGVATVCRQALRDSSLLSYLCASSRLPVVMASVGGKDGGGDTQAINSSLQRTLGHVMTIVCLNSCHAQYYQARSTFLWLHRFHNGAAAAAAPASLPPSSPAFPLGQTHQDTSAASFSLARQEDNREEDEEVSPRTPPVQTPRGSLSATYVVEIAEKHQVGEKKKSATTSLTPMELSACLVDASTNTEAEQQPRTQRMPDISQCVQQRDKEKIAPRTMVSTSHEECEQEDAFCVQRPSAPLPATSQRGESEVICDAAIIEQLSENNALLLRENELLRRYVTRLNGSDEAAAAHSRERRRMGAQSPLPVNAVLASEDRLYCSRPHHNYQHHEDDLHNSTECSHADVARPRVTVAAHSVSVSTRSTTDAERLRLLRPLIAQLVRVSCRIFNGWPLTPASLPLQSRSSSSPSRSSRHCRHGGSGACAADVHAEQEPTFSDGKEDYPEQFLQTLKAIDACMNKPGVERDLTGNTTVSAPPFDHSLDYENGAVAATVAGANQLYYSSAKGVEPDARTPRRYDGDTSQQHGALPRCALTREAELEADIVRLRQRLSHYGPRLSVLNEQVASPLTEGIAVLEQRMIDRRKRQEERCRERGRLLAKMEVQLQRR